MAIINEIFRSFFRMQMNIHTMTILVVFIVFATQYACTKLNKKMVDFCVGAFMLILFSTWYFFSNTTGSVFMNYYITAFTMVSVIFILHFLPLKGIDYICIFLLILTQLRFGYKYTLTLGTVFDLIALFLIILTTSYIRLRRVKGQLFYIWFAFVLTAFTSFGFTFFYENFVRRIGYYFRTDIMKIIVWGVSACFVVSILLGVIYLLKSKLNHYFHEINEMGKSYPSIEKHFILSTIGILVIMTTIEAQYLHFAGYANFSLISSLFKMLSVLALFLQLLYLTLLFRVAYLRDNLVYIEQENQSLAMYTSSLEKNLHEVKEIKHDIKNIFFTMGQFVEETDNQQMKDFYRDKIYPFAEETIKKNDLHGILSHIPHEQLKAFLFYKVSQALDRDIQFDIQLEIQANQFKLGLSFTDIVRILGIFIDNAIEECVTIAEPYIILKITQNDQLISYRLMNTVHPDKKNTGIRPGISTKGENRGRGLKIVQETLEKYDIVTLNSFFQDDYYVQHINIYLSV